MTRLSVNVNKVATLRNTRHVGIPDPVHFAKLALEAGAHGITVHPRPDQRHIRPDDVAEIAKLLRHYPKAEFNIEGNPFIEYEKYVRDYRPTQCTLVPDSPEAVTTDHGWERADADRLKAVVRKFKSLGCRVSIFMDPQDQLMDLPALVGADRVELYTAPYAQAFAEDKPDPAARYASCAGKLAEKGVGVNAGHDLNLQNLGPFLAAVPNVLEVSIGHALVADALEFGMAGAVARYLGEISRSAD